MPPALPISSPALQILLCPCWGQGRSPGRAHESCQGRFVALFLPLLRVSGGVGRLSGLAEPGLEKFERDFHGKPLAPAFLTGLSLPRLSVLCGPGCIISHLFLCAVHRVGVQPTYQLTCSSHNCVK